MKRNCPNNLPIRKVHLCKIELYSAVMKYRNFSFSESDCVLALQATHFDIKMQEAF